jgi:hypothetical protein
LYVTRGGGRERSKRREGGEVLGWSWAEGDGGKGEEGEWQGCKREKGGRRRSKRKESWRRVVMQREKEEEGGEREEEGDETRGFLFDTYLFW